MAATKGKYLRVEGMRPLSVMFVIMACFGCMSKGTAYAGQATFVNAKGHEIVLTRNFAIIGGVKLPGKDCSNDEFQCVRYGNHFAIVAPKRCARIADWRWSTNSINVEVMAASPHSPDEMLLTTSVGSLAAYTFSRNGGISTIYYRPNGDIGNKQSWHRKAYVNVETEIYRSRSGQAFLACT